MLGQSKCLQGILLTEQGMRIRLIYQAIADKDPWLNAAHGQPFCNGQERCDGARSELLHVFSLPLLYMTIDNTISSAIDACIINED